MSEDLPDRMSEDMPGRMSEDMRERMPDRLSEDKPDRMSEDMPDRMSDGMNWMPWWGSLEAKYVFIDILSVCLCPNDLHMLFMFAFSDRSLTKERFLGCLG